MPNPRISTDPAEQDVAVIHRFLAEESKWARGIPLELVRESIANSLNFGLFVGERQVGYARVVSDYATFAYLLDVFVLDAHRGNGYSRLLMDAVMDHPRLQGLRRFVLFTSNAHGLYEKFGFTAPAHPDTMMEIMVPNAYAAR
ncbi:N-acetyltransferase [Jeongeupia sp. HS-3]|uniref:GNAT family N-acetyltransferase n=1 Tax=Jeongeupia sp. HS-3 TaxID=1009682 RepID=UPI0018A4F4BE|nr:GNAT family N-acetyltransferase [Jeongeupia sp. HS-3]BCL76655.1 N-acetyltransferase [Jeongeupia sp. HS-3]